MKPAKRREREKEIQREKRRNQILDAARIFFRAKGFNGATIEDIAREAELSPATLYFYFKSKDEIYASINLRVIEHIIETLKKAYKVKGLNASQKLESLREALYNMYKFDPQTLVNLIHVQANEQTGNLSEEVISETDRLSAQALKVMAGFFEDAIEEGIFHECDPIMLADILVSTFNGIVLWEESKKMRDPENSSIKATMDQAFDIFLRGNKKISVD